MRALTLAAACFVALAASGQAQAQFDLHPLLDSLALADDPVPTDGGPSPAPAPELVPDAPGFSDPPLPPLSRVPLPQDLSDQQMLSDESEPAPLDEGRLHSDSLQDAAPAPADGQPTAAEQPLEDSTESDDAQGGVPESIDFDQAIADQQRRELAPALGPPTAPLLGEPLDATACYHGGGCRGAGGPCLPPPATSESYYRTPPCYQNLWDGYAAQRQRECHHLHRHLHGQCKCMQPKHPWQGPTLHPSAPCGAAPCAACSAAHDSGDRPSWLSRCRDWFSGDGERPLPAAAAPVAVGGPVSPEASPHCAHTPPDAPATRR